MSDPLGNNTIRFAAFELDPETGELRKHGLRIRLQDQPFKILIALLEKPGEVVSRDELRERIWGKDTFVDFDHSLSAAVNRLRESLSDSADNPRYVETMARRGYRFIAPVEAPLVPGPVEYVPPPEPLRQTAITTRSYKRPVWMAACLLLIGGTGLWLARDRSAIPPPRVIPLTTLTGNEIMPALSPDGKRVAFVWSIEKQRGQDIYVKVVGEERLSRLTSDPAPDWFPVWSPDGRHIAFARLGPQGGIYLISFISPLGGPERKLAGLVTNSRPSWSADGKFLLVVKGYTEGKSEPGAGALFLIPVATGGDPREILTPPHGTWYRDPTYSPDGRSLAFLSCTGALGGPGCTLHVVGLKDGLVPYGKPRPIQKYSDPFGLTWTADGSSLIYSSEKYLWRVDTRNGKAAERLELAGIHAMGPAFWAGRLAYSRTSRYPDVWRLEPEGKESGFLTSSLLDAAPQYSPDGSRIAFVSSRGGDCTAIWGANADGTEVSQITRIASPKSGTPRWSPNGKWIAFEASGNAGGWDIWVVEAGGGSPQQVTHGPADNILPSWSGDGNWIYFTSKRSGGFEIWRVPAQGGVEARITHSGGFLALESTNAKTIYYTKSENGTEGLYAKLLPDGDETQVMKEAVALRGLAVFSDGVYYLHPGQNSYEIRFHEFGGRARIVSKVENQLDLASGLAVSPDRKTFLFSKIAGSGSDLMLIENFR